jgi:hypothetical protein
VTAFEGALHTLRETPSIVAGRLLQWCNSCTMSARMERMLTSVAPHIACYGMRAPEGLLKRCRRWIAETVVPCQPQAGHLFTGRLFSSFFRL